LGAAQSSLLLLLTCSSLAGCASPFGELKKTLTLDRLWQATQKSAIDPLTWVPAAGALVIAVGDYDDEISDWARRHHPVYGSAKTARDVSDILWATSGGSYLLGWYARPVTESYTEEKKTRDLVVQGGAILATLGTTEGLKKVTGRDRPNGEDDKSFPSGHSSGSAALSTSAMYQIRKNEKIPEGWRTAGSVAFIALPYATGWARIEADKHWPTDILFGIALGNFFANIANSLINEKNVRCYARPTEDGGVMLGISISF